MPEHDPQRLELAHQVQQELARENVLSRRQARSFVRAIQTDWQNDTIQWREHDSVSQFRDSERLIHVARIFSEIEGRDSLGAALCYRRAGEQLEWLARSNDEIQTNIPLGLLSAAAYQLGGLPAMASGLLKQVQYDEPGNQIYADFLSGRFGKVIAGAAAFWRSHPELRGADATALIFDRPEAAPDEEHEIDAVSWYATVELIRCLGLIADTLQRGDMERLEIALRKMNALERFALQAFPFPVSLFLKLLHETVQHYKDGSIYNATRQLAEINTDYEPQLYKFAVSQFRRGRGILWASQRRGLEKLVNESSFALCTPTGSGKTLVANLALVKELLLQETDGFAPLALYLVPSRALAGEVEAKLTSELGNDFIITGLYGGSDWGITDYWIEADRPTVLIATVEKADALMRYLGPLLIARLKLLIIDEAHQVVSELSLRELHSIAEHRNRAIRMEGLISRILSLAPDTARVALTAVAGGAAQPVASWVEGRMDAQPIGLNYRSTRQVIGVLETRPNQASTLRLEYLNGERLELQDRGEPVYLNLGYPPMPQPRASIRNSLNHYNQLNILWTAFHLAAGDKRILISLPQRPEYTMRWFSEAVILEEWQQVTSFTAPADGFDRSRFDEACEACRDYCGEDSFELVLLQHGIASNHGQMPQRLRRLMTDLIERRICPIVVATATLTEGVNLPFDVIVLPTLKRDVFDPETETMESELLSSAEFRNLAGRAGRPGAAKGMEGMLLVGLPTSPSTTANGPRNTQRRQVIARRSEYDEMMRKLAEEDDGAISAPLELLITAIRALAETHLNLGDDDAFLEWLEITAPSEISDEVGLGATDDKARIADSVDELDGFLLSIFAEIKDANVEDYSVAELEGFLSSIWRRTFSAVTAHQEELLERAFITRGKGAVATIYPDADERKRLYRYGYSPSIGRRFEVVQNDILDTISGAADYGILPNEQRLALFVSLGQLVKDDGGYGFKIGQSQQAQNLLDNWEGVLAWWMNAEEAPRPEPKDLRAWQRFTSENLEFRLGVAIGAAIAQAWTDGADNPYEVPSLAEWKETTELPWIGFWAKELLRWGTLDPFIAFALSQGLVRSRSEAAEKRNEFHHWLEQKVEAPQPEDRIDPQRFLAWQRELPREDRRGVAFVPVDATLTGTDGENGEYHVVPIVDDEGVIWIDASGYELARSVEQPEWLSAFPYLDHFKLTVDAGTIKVSMER